MTIVPALNPNSQPANRPQYLTIGQVAQMLSVSGKTIQRRIRSGELRAVRLRGASDGGRQTILIDQADVLALLEPYTGNEVAA